MVLYQTKKEKIMLKRCVCLALVVALFCVVSAPSVFANPKTSDEKLEGTTEPVATTNSGAKSNENLRTAVDKMLADTKAGTTKIPARSQMQPAQSNGLSKGKKIAIVAGVAVVVVAIIVVIHARNHFFDDFRLGN
jgi:hypothetical protein